MFFIEDDYNFTVKIFNPVFALEEENKESEKRFFREAKILFGDDEILLRFLSEMFHPVVLKKHSDWKAVLENINNLLDADGYEIYESTKISNRAVYSYRLKI